VRRRLAALSLLVTALLGAPGAAAITKEAEEFLRIARELEPVHCEKRKLCREIALAHAERREAEARTLQARFDELGRDPKTARLEKRLGELERRLTDGRGGIRDPRDLEAISRQQREAYYRCR
jgi:hypothetical protein